jgi:hypothetical protein
MKAKSALEAELLFKKVLSAAPVLVFILFFLIDRYFIFSYH